jgi:hypothetical protein
MTVRRLIHWTPEKIDLALRCFYHRHGRYPYWDECLQCHELPPRQAILRHRGSLAAAIAAVGGTPPPKRAAQRRAA